MLFTEDPDEDEENSEESLEDESEEEVTETPESSSLRPLVCIFPPPPVWAQRNQGLSTMRHFSLNKVVFWQEQHLSAAMVVSYSAELDGTH